jgi:hypothetical protein
MAARQAIMSRLRYAVGIFVVAVSVRGFLLSLASSGDFLYGRQTEAGFHSADEGINVSVALSRTGNFADPFVEPTGPTAHVPPLFPLVTACLFRVAGYGTAAAAIRNGLNIAGLGLLFASFPFAASVIGLGVRPGGIAGALAAVFRRSGRARYFAGAMNGRPHWSCCG